MNIQIFGEIELLEHIRQGGTHFSHLISIRNKHSFMGPLEEEITGAFIGILDLEFHDIETREWMPPGSEHIPIPELEDIRRVQTFVGESRLSKGFTGFTIHCWRGVSRSAAVALGIIYSEEGDEKSALENLLKIRPEARPLNRIVEFWDVLLGSRLKAETDRYREEQSRAIVQQSKDYLISEYIEDLEPLE
jgi:predicted protein tyrosine phosphatase